MDKPMLKIKHQLYILWKCPISYHEFIIGVFSFILH